MAYTLWKKQCYLTGPCAILSAVEPRALAELALRLSAWELGTEVRDGERFHYEIRQGGRLPGTIGFVAMDASGFWRPVNDYPTNLLLTFESVEDAIERAADEVGHDLNPLIVHNAEGPVHVVRLQRVFDHLPMGGMAVYQGDIDLLMRSGSP